MAIYKAGAEPLLGLAAFLTPFADLVRRTVLEKPQDLPAAPNQP